MKKILSLILTVIMILSIMPVAALVSSADETAAQFIYEAAITGVKDGKNTVTIVGAINSEELIADIDKINLSVTFTGLENEKTVECEVKSVYKTIIDVATTDATTASSQTIAHVEAAYIYALTVVGVPEDVYTITAKAEAVKDGEENPVDTTASAPIIASVNTAADVLTHAAVGVSGTTYKGWEEKSFGTEAVWAGQSAGDKTSIQLRSSNSNSGLVVTKSAGKVLSITLSFHEDTADARTVNIYGKNEAYEAATDLYDTSKQGTKIGSITKSEGLTQTLTIDGDYTYIGLRSNSSALYLTSVVVVWDTDYEYVEPTVTDEEKVAAALEEITLPDEIESNEEGFVLPTASTTYPEVTFSWTSDTEDLILVDENGETVVGETDENWSVTLTVTAVCNGVSDTKSFSVTVKENVTYTDEENIVLALYKLGTGEKLEGKYLLTGTITEISEAYSEQFGNITVKIVVGKLNDKPVECFRLSGTGADKLAVGDVITVYGELLNYNNGKKQFTSGCKLFTDDYKVDQALVGLSLPKSISEEDIFELAQAGTGLYKDVVITWTLDGEEYNDDSIILTPAEADVTYTLIATATSGEATAVKEFTIKVIGTATVVVTPDPETVTFADLGYSNADNVTTVDCEKFTIEFSKANGSNDPKYYTSGAAVRVYANNTFTFSSEYAIAKIEFTFVSSSTNYSGTLNFSDGEYDAASATSGVWTGNAQEVTITNTSGQCRIVSVVVTFA